MSDDPSSPFDPIVSPAEQQPADPLPPLEQDRAVLAWLHGSEQLTAAATGHLCEALLEWALIGSSWPQEETEPTAGPDCDHLQVLVQITERLTQRITLVQPLSAKFDLARIGQHLSQAVACQRDPDALQQALDRELVHRMPWLAGPPAPVVYADGRTL
jgi:hypothetical protein